MNLDETLERINGSIRSLNAYHLDPEACAIKLNQNENPYDWPLPIKEEAARFCRERPWNRYPPFVPDELKDALAAYVGARPGSVIVGNGSNEMLLVLLLSLTHRDAIVIGCQPTFTVYKLLVTGLGAQLCTVPLTTSLEYDIDGIIAASHANPHSLLILCSPNNPTGSTIDENGLRRILSAHKGFCIFDQAYVEFGGYDAVPLLAEYPHLIITRSYSKAFAGAGLRLGYLVGNPAVVKEINKIKLPYNINFFIEHVAVMLAKNQALIAETHGTIVRERDELFSFLKTLPFENVYRSAANFILVRCRDKDALWDTLRNAGILVRDVSTYPMLERCLRISVGTASENAALKTALRSFFTDSR
ncbi:MAG: histidinol-phosphate transaminase [Chitinispirillaceae bacterium]|nr:histidinol-phosphate transaminase [Chitinispirillaceae bacterium]